MFNDRYGLTDAVLEGRKTMTRRAVSDKIIAKAKAYQQEYFATTLDAISLEDAILELSTYKIGEEVAIAQKYSECVNDILVKWGHKTDIAILAFKKLAGWTNKMFVRADLMPHRIRITDIRVERLQDISDEDCLREGVMAESVFNDNDYCTFLGSKSVYFSPREAFAALIDKVSGKGTWESNPYVWVYSFELIK